LVAKKILSVLRVRQAEIGEPILRDRNWPGSPLAARLLNGAGLVVGEVLHVQF
jgi:hypothetical protein